ncbi:MAG: hypothetical protein FJW99_08260 [Actinobacteria bacterium]|nr:hypothetical protein [Actinomycetota bacterium]MBM3698009.1 hypothetical protein [Actinomycetota bacterium]
MGESERKPVPGGLSTSLGRAAVADPAANPWGALVVGLGGTQAEGVEAMCWFADGNALVSALAMEIPLWNVNPADAEDAHRARELASMGQRIVAGGGAGEETFAYSAPAVKHLLQQDADVRWLGKLDDLMTGEDALAVELRAAFTSDDGADPVAEPERGDFITFVRERYS